MISSDHAMEHIHLLCRGKFDVLFTQTSLVLRNAKNVLLQVLYTDIKAVYILDSLPEQRAGKIYLVLQFKGTHTVTHGKRELDNFTLELSDKQTLDVPDPQAVLQGKQEANKKVLCSFTFAFFSHVQTRRFFVPSHLPLFIHHAATTSTCVLSSHHDTVQTTVGDHYAPFIEL
jgi:hypothetical protein